MELIINIFNIVLYRPLFNILILLYEYLPGHDFGVAIIILTVLVRLILYPLMIQPIKFQKIQAEIQPKIQEIQRQFKNDKERQTREILALYKKEKINPFGGCLPLLIQIPIIIALFQVFRQGLNPASLENLYSFIPRPEIINFTFLGIINLSKPSIYLAILAGIFQFFQTKMISPQKNKIFKNNDPSTQFSNMMQKQMLYFFPIFTVFILLNLPAAIGLYWIITSLFSIGQQYLVFKNLKYVQSK